MRKADLKEQLEISQEQIAKQQRAIEKKLRKKGVPEPAESFATPEEFADRPEPKVVDTTALPTEPAPPRKKPSLAELKRAGKSARPRFNNAQEWDAENYALPGIDLLDEHDSEGRVAADPAELEEIQQDADRDARPVRHCGGARRHHQGPDHHALRSLSGQRRARGQDRQPRARPRPRHPRRADQHPRADSRQGHGRHRDRQYAAK